MTQTASTTQIGLASEPDAGDTGQGQEFWPEPDLSDLFLVDSLKDAVVLIPTPMETEGSREKAVASTTMSDAAFIEAELEDPEPAGDLAEYPEPSGPEADLLLGLEDLPTGSALPSFPEDVREDGALAGAVLRQAGGSPASAETGEVYAPTMVTAVVPRIRTPNKVAVEETDLQALSQSPAEEESSFALDGLASLSLPPWQIENVLGGQEIGGYPHSPSAAETTVKLQGDSPSGTSKKGSDRDPAPTATMDGVFLNGTVLDIHALNPAAGPGVLTDSVNNTASLLPASAPLRSGTVEAAAQQAPYLQSLQGPLIAQLDQINVTMSGQFTMEAVKAIAERLDASMKEANLGGAVPKGQTTVARADGNSAAPALDVLPRPNSAAMLTRSGLQRMAREFVAKKKENKSPQVAEKALARKLVRFGSLRRYVSGVAGAGIVAAAAAITLNQGSLMALVEEGGPAMATLSMVALPAAGNGHALVRMPPATPQLAAAEGTAQGRGGDLNSGVATGLQAKESAVKAEPAGPTHDTPVGAGTHRSGAVETSGTGTASVPNSGPEKTLVKKKLSGVVQNAQHLMANNDYGQATRALETAWELARALNDETTLEWVRSQLVIAYVEQGELMMKEELVTQQDCDVARGYFSKAFALGYTGERSKANLIGSETCTNRRPPSRG